MARDRQRLRPARRGACRRPAVPRARTTRSAPPGLIGGGSPPRPGEATLAHRGVLFLDELCEFRRDALEALRAPLESGEVSIARAGGRRSLPCRFMLVAAANPCPCGRGEADPECSCAPLAVQRYQGRLSGALADRIDILAAVRQPSAAEIGGGPGEPSAAVGERVCAAARERQERRLGPGRCNAEMTPGEARDCALSPEAAVAAGRALRAAAAQRPRPRPGAAPGADDRRPRRAARRSARTRWRRRCSCGGGTDRLSQRACPDCLRRSWLLALLGPYIEKIATGAVGSRSPELLRLSNEDLVAVAAPKVAGQLLARVEALAEARSSDGAAGGGVLGLLPPRRPLPGRPARRRRRALGADRARRPGPARRPGAVRAR